MTRRPCPRAALLILALLLTSMGRTTFAAEIPLWPDGAAPLPPNAAVAEQPGAETVENRNSEGPANRWVTGTTQPTLKVHSPQPTLRSGAAMVVCPGGGYAGMAFDKEGENVCEWLAQRGVTAFTLKYRHGGGAHQHPIPLADVERAVRWVRCHADEFGIEPDRIGVMGFSAGGHLASTIGTHFQPGKPEADDPVERHSSRPDFLVLIYPVISMDEAITHAGSRERLLGKSPEAEVVAELSNDQQVSDATPPTFLVHASDDHSVPVENSLRFYRALVEHHVPAELHVYEQGGHGFGMLHRELPVDHWPAAFEAWLRSRELIR